MALQEGVLYLKSTGDPPAVQPGMIEEIEEYLESIAPQAVIDQLEVIKRKNQLGNLLTI